MTAFRVWNMCYCMRRRRNQTTGRWAGGEARRRGINSFFYMQGNAKERSHNSLFHGWSVPGWLSWTRGEMDASFRTDDAQGPCIIFFQVAFAKAAGSRQPDVCVCVGTQLGRRLPCGKPLPLPPSSNDVWNRHKALVDAKGGRAGRDFWRARLNWCVTLC